MPLGRTQTVPACINRKIDENRSVNVFLLWKWKFWKPKGTNYLCQTQNLRTWLLMGLENYCKLPKKVMQRNSPILKGLITALAACNSNTEFAMNGEYSYSFWNLQCAGVTLKIQVKNWRNAQIKISKCT